MDRFPQHLDIQQIDPEVDQPVKASTAKSGHRHERRSLAHNFRTEIALTKGTSLAERGEAMWFLETHVGQLFELVVPVESDPQGSAPATASVVGGAVKGATIVTLAGYPPSAADAVLARDPVVFAGHTKVYRLGPAASDGTGRVTCPIHPPLLQPLTAGEVATTQSVPFTGRLEPGSLDGSVSGLYNPFSFEFREDV